MHLMQCYSLPLLNSTRLLLHFTCKKPFLHQIRVCSLLTFWKQNVQQTATPSAKQFCNDRKMFTSRLSSRWFPCYQGGEASQKVRTTVKVSVVQGNRVCSLLTFCKQNVSKLQHLLRIKPFPNTVKQHN